MDFKSNFAYALTINRSVLGLLSIKSYGLGYCQNFISAQYLLNESVEFDQILHYALTLMVAD